MPAYPLPAAPVVIATHGCPVCEHPARWTVDGQPVCAEHLSDILAGAWSVADGFTPPLVLPLRAVLPVGGSR